MQDQQPRRVLSPIAIASFSAVLIAVGSGAAWWAWKTQSVPPIPTPLEHAQPTQPDQGGNAAIEPTKGEKLPSPAPAVTAEKTLQIYWLTASGSQIQLAPSSVKLTASNAPDSLLATAVKQLLAGPTQTNVATTIPAGTQLLDLSVKPDGIHINLSREFKSGGGSTAMAGRLAQVLYTVTSLNPEAAIWLSVDGKPLATLGGEGLEVSQPLTRNQFKKDFPVF